MSGTLVITNRQRAVAVDLPLLRRLTRSLLEEALGVEEFDLAVCLVAPPEMARLNQTYLGHEGSTDVITFDYSDSAAADPSSVAVLRRVDVRRLPPRNPKSEIRNPKLTKPPHSGRCEVHGEIFICLDDARSQARAFRTTWQSELARYVIHGVLHLLGHDDTRPAARRRMKREEERLLKAMAKEFSLGALANKKTKK